MKTSALWGILIVAAAFATAGWAEPASWDMLSYRQDKAAAPADKVTQIAHPAGLGKYRPYHVKYETTAVDTEIAAFEEETRSEEYSKPERRDRIH